MRDSDVFKNKSKPARALSQMAKGTRRLYTLTRQGGNRTPALRPQEQVLKAKFRRHVTRQVTVHLFSLHGLFPSLFAWLHAMARTSLRIIKCARRVFWL